MSSFTRVCLLIGSLVLAVSSAAFVPIAGTRNAAVSTRVWGSATVIERESVVAPARNGPAILDRPSEVVERPTRTTKEPTKERKQQGDEAWEVRIYNDGLNTREHVARSLVQVTGLSEVIAYQTMMQAHHNGIAVVGRWVFEVAEMYHEELKRNGIVCDIVPVDEDK